MSTVKDGDVVVLGTDGLFDNVHDAQLERAVRMGTKLGFSPKNMAGIAYNVSRNDKAWTLYSVGYLKASLKS
nr:unnamed protein product [Digitaria exilis]